MELHDPRRQRLREGREVRRLVAAGRHHHVPRFVAREAGRHLEAVRGERAQFADRLVERERQRERSRVAGEVVGDLVLGRQVLRRRGERQVGQRGVARRCEEPQRVPARAPRITHPRRAVQDEEAVAVALELTAHRQPGLTAADHQHVVVPRRMDARLHRTTPMTATESSGARQCAEERHQLRALAGRQAQRVDLGVAGGRARGAVVVRDHRLEVRDLPGVHVRRTGRDPAK